MRKSEHFPTKSLKSNTKTLIKVPKNSPLSEYLLVRRDTFCAHSVTQILEYLFWFLKAGVARPMSSLIRRVEVLAQSILFALILTAILSSSAVADICPDPNEPRCAGAPTNLSATVNSATQVTLTCTPPQHGGDTTSVFAYRIDYLTPELFFSLARKNEWVHQGYLFGDNTGYVPTTYKHDHVLVPETVLRYRVSAINIFGVGAYSDEYEITTPPAPDTAGNGPPDITDITVNGTQIVITFDESLDPSSVPSTTSFWVNILGRFWPELENVRVTGATVEIILTEADVVKDSDVVSVSYYPPEIQIGEAILPITTNALKDLEGNLVMEFRDSVATNNTLPNTDPPANTDPSTKPHSAPTDLTDDRAVLVALYNATDGENWSDKTNWDTDEPLDTWYGVTTNSDGRITKLNLSTNQLRGSIPDVLGRLIELTFLALDNNILSGKISTELGNLTNLRRLHLNDNQLTSMIPLAQFEALVAPADSVLQELALWGNDQLTGMEGASDELGKRVDRAVLRTLYESNGGPQWKENENWLHPTDPFSFSDWRGVFTNSDGRVSELSLVNNGLKGKIKNALESLAELETLDLSGNIGLSGMLPQGLIGLSNLRMLYIEETSVCASENAAFQRWLDNIDFRGENCVMDAMQKDETTTNNEVGCTLASDEWTVTASERAAFNLLLTVLTLIAILCRNRLKIRLIRL